MYHQQFKKKLNPLFKFFFYFYDIILLNKVITLSYYSCYQLIQCYHQSLVSECCWLHLIHVRETIRLTIHTSTIANRSTS